jgi:hypothetical protein
MNAASALICGCAALSCFVGCGSGQPTAEVDGSGFGNGPESQTVSCGTTASLERNLTGGVGTVSVTVLDGKSNTVYQNSNAIAGTTDDTQELSGSSGTWTLVVNPQDFAGQYKITLQCP